MSVGDRTWAKYARAPLDPSFLKLDDAALEFFHATISTDDEELRKRIFEVQKQYVILSTAPHNTRS